MRRKFTLLTAALMLLTFVAQPLRVTGQTRAEEVAYTLDGTITGGTNAYAEASEITQSGVTWMVTGNTTMDPWRIGGKNLNEVDRPVYSTGTLSDNITKIVVTHGTAANITVNSMTLVVSANSDFSSPTSTLTGTFEASSTTTFNRPTGADWTNKYYKLVYNVSVSGNSNKFLQFISAEFYKDNSGGGTQTVATPTFSPVAGTYNAAQNVTISTTTAGATIHYTLDGNNPTTSSPVYSSPIAISTTTTVKAMAVKSGMNNSAVASATYTIQDAPTLVTIAAARALSVGTSALVQGVITFIDGRNVYVQDETAGIDLYLNSAVSTLNLGDKVQAYGQVAQYKGLVELSGIDPNDASQFSVISTGNTLPLAVKTIAEINADAAGSNLLQSTRVQIVEATVGTINTNNNTPITQGENSLNIYKMPAVDGLVEGDVITVIGVIGCYNTPQLRVALASDVTIHQQQLEDVATPTFSPAAGTYTEAQNVTISCATTGATIYYTIDGTDPSVNPTGINGTQYTQAITVSETTTIKAMAVKANMNNSQIATAVYTIETGPSLITIAEAKALNTNEYALVQGVVTFIDGRNVYVQDETAGIDLYLNANAPSTLALGHKVQAYGKKAVYKGLIELSGIDGTDPDQFSVISTGNTLPLAVKTIAEINADAVGSNLLQSTRVQVVEATIGTINTNGNTPITQGENTINLYKMPAVDGLQENDIVTVNTVIGCFNTVQLRVASAADVTFTHPQPAGDVATPTFSPEAGTYSAAQEVTISCATEGATIYYTIDGTDPSVNAAAINGTEYTQAITVSETTTLKAIAVKQGMNNSAIATAVYTINIVPPAVETAYKLITHTNALISGDKYIIVGIKGEGYKALGKQATNNRVAVDVTLSDTVIVVTPASEAGQDAVYELTLGQENGNWTLYDAANGGYLYAASSSANQLKIQTENDANGQWTIDIASNGVATIKAQGTNTRNWLRLNNSGTPFACYASGQLDVYLYKAGDVPTPPAPTYYAVNVAQVTNGTVQVSATQAEEGDTIYVTATPAANYELTTLTYSYTGTNPVSIMETRQFIMPAADVTVEATFTALQTVIAPAFSLAAGSYIQAQEVTLTCATDGATIHYTIDGTDPTPNSPVYSVPLTISETTTVKAMATKEGMVNSAISTAIYTIIESITIAEAKALNTNEYALVSGVVTFIDGRNVYVQDATAGIDLFLNNNTVPTELAVGDEVLGYGKKAVYNGLIELSGINGGNANQFVILSSGNILPTAQVKTIEEILADFAAGNLLQSTRVQIVEAKIGTINTNGNTPITQNGSTLNLYKMPVVEGLLANDIVTVTGVVGCYNNPQLRINSADEVTFVHPPVVTVNPASLAGFNYVEGEGPSVIKTFDLSATNLVGPAYVYPSTNYEISSVGGDYFIAENCISINGAANFTNLHIYVRLKAGLALGSYEESLYACSDGADTVYVALSGNVTEPVQASDYLRLTDVAQLVNGSKVIFAARFDGTPTDYYAMTNTISGKIDGVLFSSTTSETGGETLPGSIADADSLYYWTVATDGTNFTFTNANGAVLGYNSGTNFTTGGDNTAWTIEFGTSDPGAMVPEYGGFVVTNANNTGRAFALNNTYHSYGAYSKSNMTGNNASGYNFFLDMFAIAGTGTMVCATPTISPEGGTYYEAQEVTITCSTADATIHYTLDGSDPTASSEVYTEPITISESTTVKAIAMKEGYDDSAIAEAEYTIILGAVTIFNQDWEGDMNGWTFVTVTGSKPWNVSQHNGNHYAYANGYNGGENEQWCISPAFNLESYSDVTLTFMNAKNYTGPDLQLFFSNDYDGQDPTAATWTELTFNKSEGSFAWAESGTIEFVGFSGNNCYLGYKYTSTETEAAAWEVDDIMLVGFTSDPVLGVTPLTLSFTYTEGNGPSNEQTFAVTGFNLSENVVLTLEGDAFEMSSTSGEDFDPMDEYEIEPYEGAIDEVIYVRLAEGLEVGTYTATITVTSELDDVTVTLNGTVNEPIQGGDWIRIASLADLNDGDQLVIASRYDATVGDGYYAMTAEVSGKPDGVLFTSVNDNGIEMLPEEIIAEVATFAWNVTVNDTVITLTNAEGDMLGYSTSTNFAANTNTDWAITFGTAGENAMVPGYSGFVITNVTTPNRGVAKNASNKFGAYSTSNINNGDYNFYLDLFVLGGTSTPTVATPVFSVASGTYYEEFDVEITCTTEGATIYYTNDGSDPTAQSMVYDGPIHVDADVTLKAIAMMEGYENSGIATVNYVVITGQTVILSQDWEGEMNGWTFVTVEGNKPWTVSSYGGNHYAYANGYNDDVDNEQWCISPTFDLTYFTDVVLTFRNAKNYTGPDLQLFFADDYDGQDPTAASWQPLQFNMSTGGYAWVESGEISLDGFRSENCNIAFRYISTIDDGAAAWEVDDILILGTGYDAVDETVTMDVTLWNHSDEIFVENNTRSDLQMVVFNLLGQPVLAKDIATGSVRFSHQLAQGVYVVTLQNAEGRMAVKMIVR